MEKDLFPKMASNPYFSLTLRAYGWVKVKISLRRPGLSDLSPRVFRPPKVWTASSVDNVSLDGEFIPFPGSMLGPLISDGAAITAIRSPPGVIGSEPNVSLPAPTSGYAFAVRIPLGTLQEVQYHRKKATLVGQQVRMLQIGRASC